MPIFDLENITPISLEDLTPEIKKENKESEPKQSKNNLDNINTESSFGLSDKNNDFNANNSNLVNYTTNNKTLKKPKNKTAKDNPNNFSNDEINEFKKVSKRKKEEKNKEFKERLVIDRGEDLLLSIKECELLTGISNVSIRKALKDREIDYTIENRQYRISFEELLRWCYSSTRRKNVLNMKGIGKYVREWKKY